MNLDVLWSNLLNELKNKLTSLSYQTWFSETQLYKIKDNKAYIIVPMPIHKNHLMDKYSDMITSILYEQTNTNYDLVFLLNEEIEEEKEKEKEESLKAKISSSLDNIDNNFNSNLNKEYNFETFIVGNSNKFAQAAALSVAEQPGKMYNPLFIYGNSGVGKTHLMHAIGNYIQSTTNKRVLYVTCEQFINEYSKINRKSNDGTNFNYVEFFKSKYRDIDVLIIDDIQFLGPAKQSQTEFFHTFNNLFNDKKQIIISSDSSPDDLKQLEDRLRTRFVWGLTVNISPPDYTLKMDILRKKILATGFDNDIPDDVVEYIASNVGPSVRSLEGAVNRLVAYSAIWGGKDITLDLAVEALNEFVYKGLGEKNDIQRIQKIVANYFQISIEDIRSKKRSSNISFPRQIAMYLCRTMTTESFPKIGIEFGGKDHSTVMHSVEKIENEIKENKDLANIIEKLKKDIGVV